MSLLAKIKKNSTNKLTNTLDESEIFMDVDVVSTDVPIINVAFSGELDGGIASGLTILAGSSGTFKSNLSLLCMSAFLNRYPDGVGIIYDCEGGMTPSYVKSFGIPTDRLVHIPFTNIEELKFDIVNQLEEFTRSEKVMIIIDSIGNAPSKKELDDALDQKTKAEMQRAKALKGFFRMITPSLVMKDIPCIAIAHTYEEMGLFPKTIVSGGSGLMYSSNQCFIITKSQDKDGKELNGWNFTINIEKSRFVRQKSRLTFTVSYKDGIKKISGLKELAIEAGLLIQSGAWFQRVDPDTGEIEEKKIRSGDLGADFYVKLLKSKMFKEFVKKKYKLPDGSAQETDEELEVNMEDE